MSQTKKLLSLLLAVMMVLVASTAMAAQVTLPSGAPLENHTFNAYQIFEGTESGGTDGKPVVLSSINWGNGIDSTAFVKALQDDENYGSLFTGKTSAADVAEVLASKASDEAFAKWVAKTADAHLTGTGTQLASGTTDLESGYYLILDTTSFGESDTNTVKNVSLLQVVGTVNVQVKTDVPEVQKKVKDINDSTFGANIEDSAWEDTADHDVGDIIPFQLKATLPNNVSAYESYKLVFHDTMSSGLTYQGITSVKIGGNTVTNTEGQAPLYTVEHNNGALTITFADAKLAGATDNSEVIIEYTAQLNDNAVMGSTGNDNKVYLEYSNNPNHGGEGETGKTPEDRVVVFTYKLVVNKVKANPDYNADTDPQNTGKDGDGDPQFVDLPGASFALYKKDANGAYQQIGDTLTGPAMTEFKWERLDDGDYKLSEVTPPEGYNKIADIEFKVEARHDDDNDENPLNLVSLSGTKEDGAITFTPSDDKSSLTTKIENKPGSTLPETGGMGTTLLYVGGGILVAAAAILLVFKKRLSVEK